MANPPDRSGDTSRQPELEAYRGIFVPGNYSSSSPNLGMHWSTSRRVAEEMVSHAQHQLGKTAGLKDKTVIYNAIIPQSSVETDVEVLKQNKVLSPEDLSKNKEKEIPVKAGKPVKLKSKSTTTNVRTRVRTYKPPREVPA